MVGKWHDRIIRNLEYTLFIFYIRLYVTMKIMFQTQAFSDDVWNILEIEATNIKMYWDNR